MSRFSIPINDAVLGAVRKQIDLIDVGYDLAISDVIQRLPLLAGANDVIAALVVLQSQGVVRLNQPRSRFFTAQRLR